MYCTLYVLLEPVAGTALAAVLLAFTAYANTLTRHYSPAVNYYALGINIASWIAQFIGHGVFEGRAPALFDNLYQAIFLAPLFVWLEFLFALGYRADLKSRLDRYVEEDIKKFHEGKKANGSTNGHAKSG
jgi:2-hydroxy fatty acid dioxygenase